MPTVTSSISLSERVEMRRAVAKMEKEDALVHLHAMGEVDGSNEYLTVLQRMLKERLVDRTTKGDDNEFLNQLDDSVRVNQGLRDMGIPDPDDVEANGE